MNPTPVPFIPPQHLPTAPVGSIPLQNNAPNNQNQAAIQQFKKAKQSLDQHNLKQIIIEATTSAGLTQVTIASKKTTIRIRKSGEISTFECDMNTAECSLNGQPASTEDIEVFKKIANEAQTASDNNDAHVREIKRDF